jgi:hypothetical protein
MEKKSTLLPFINDQKTESDDEQFPTFFTPLSIYVNREKQAREKYIKANTWKKCIKCNLRWQISLTEAKNGLHGRNTGFCATCKYNVENPPPKTPRPISHRDNILSYISQKYPAWILTAEDRRPGDPDENKTFFHALENRESLKVIKYMCLRLPKKIFHIYTNFRKFVYILFKCLLNIVSLYFLFLSCSTQLLLKLEHLVILTCFTIIMVSEFGCRSSGVI